MGDRCNCTLKLGGILRTENIPALAAALRDADVEADRRDPEFIEKRLRLGSEEFEFDEVNYGELNHNLEDLMIKLHLSYSWHVTGGEEYDAQIDLYDARSEQAHTIKLYNGNPCLHLEEACKPEVIEETRLWLEFDQSLDCLVVSSNHDAIAKIKAKPAFSTYMDLLSKVPRDAA